MNTEYQNEAKALELEVKRLEAIDGSIAAQKEQMRDLKDERKAVIQQIKKETGYSVKVIEQILKDRVTPNEELSKYEAELRRARAAIGLFENTPLGEAALRSIEPAEKGDTLI